MWSWHVVTLTVSSAPWRDTEPAAAEVRGTRSIRHRRRTGPSAAGPYDPLAALALWIALSHLLLVFNNPFARLAGFSGRERTPLPRYEQSENLHRPIHPGHVTDERDAFKVEEVTEAELRLVPPGAGIDPGEIGRELGVGPQLLVPSKFVLDVRYHPCVIGLRQMPVTHICGDVVGKVLQLLDHDVLLDDMGSGSCRDRLLAERPSPEAKGTSRSPKGPAKWPRPIRFRSGKPRVPARTSTPLGAVPGGPAWSVMWRSCVLLVSHSDVMVGYW